MNIFAYTKANINSPAYISINRAKDGTTVITVRGDDGITTNITLTPNELDIIGMQARPALQRYMTFKAVGCSE